MDAASITDITDIVNITNMTNITDISKMKEVIKMRYDSLNELINNSRSSRKYFLSLPVDMQMALHERNAYIHTAQELRTHVFAVENYSHHIRLSGGK